LGGHGYKKNTEGNSGGSASNEGAKHMVGREDRDWVTCKDLVKGAKGGQALHRGQVGRMLRQTLKEVLFGKSSAGIREK